MIEIVKKRLEELAKSNENYHCEFLKEGEEFNSSVNYSVSTEDIDIHFAECIDITGDGTIVFGTVALLETKDELKDDLKILIDIIDHYEGYFNIFTDDECEKLQIAHTMTFDRFWEALGAADEEDVNFIAELLYSKATEIMFKFIPAVDGLSKDECSFEDAVKFVVQADNDSEELA